MDRNINIKKYKQFDLSFNVPSLSDQAVRDKIGKNNSWNVCRSWSDITTKTMNFEVIVNADETAVKTVSYDSICKDYGWKSFKWSEDGQMIIPKK